MARALVFVGLVCLAFAAGAAAVEAEVGEESTGRQLLTEGGYWYYYPSQTQIQYSGNNAQGVGTANQQSSNVGVQQWGNGNYASAGNYQNIQTFPQPPAKDPPKDPAKEPAKGGRKLLTGGYWAYYPSQTQIQYSGNNAQGVGTANQQSSNVGVQQWGSWNGVNAGNYQNIQTGEPPKDPPKDAGKDAGKGRKLLTEGGYWYYYPSQTQVQVSGNNAQWVGAANQQSSNVGVQQWGNGNGVSAGNYQNIQTFPQPPAKDPPKDPSKDPAKGRKLLTEGGYWYYYPSQTQVQVSGNNAQGVGAANQQSSNVGVQQWGNWNGAGVGNYQNIQTFPQPAAKDPPKDPSKDPAKGK